MKKLSTDTKFAHLGKPGTAFSKGFQRRLNLILEQVDLKDKVILDQGCGEGVWMYEFAKFTDPKNVYGFDVDPESIKKFELQITNYEGNTKDQIPKENIKICYAESLDFSDNFFDIVFSNEVLEHVVDDKKAVEEVYRVLKPGGIFIVFTPNSGWPFETHGMFLKSKYYWGNIPLLPWLPKIIQKKFAPHVRNYTNGEIRKLFGYKQRATSYEKRNNNSELEAESWKLIYHSHIFPGFDGAVRRFGLLGKLLQKIFFSLEKTPLNWFGISHFVIVRKENY